VGHSQAAQVFQDSSVDPDDDSDTSEDEDIPSPHSAPSQTLTLPTPKKKERGARLMKVVSKITKKVASNRLVRRAAELIFSGTAPGMV
jgi:hypothetical protein